MGRGEEFVGDGPAGVVDRMRVRAGVETMTGRAWFERYEADISRYRPLCALATGIADPWCARWAEGECAGRQCHPPYERSES